MYIQSKPSKDSFTISVQLGAGDWKESKGVCWEITKRKRSKENLATKITTKMYQPTVLMAFAESSSIISVVTINRNHYFCSNSNRL